MTLTPQSVIHKLRLVHINTNTTQLLSVFIFSIYILGIVTVVIIVHYPQTEHLYTKFCQKFDLNHDKYVMTKLG